MSSSDLTQKNIMHIALIALILFLCAFFISSHLFHAPSEALVKYLGKWVSNYAWHNMADKIQLYPRTNYYSLLSDSELTQFYISGFKWTMALSIVVNALTNFVIQPIFPSIFLPQTVFNILILPFFIYGAVRYFKVLPFMVLLFFALALYVGAKDFFIEPLIRHRISCELIYLLLGLAGLKDLIAANSS